MGQVERPIIDPERSRPEEKLLVANIPITNLPFGSSGNVTVTDEVSKAIAERLEQFQIQGKRMDRSTLILDASAAYNAEGNSVTGVTKMLVDLQRQLTKKFPKTTIAVTGINFSAERCLKETGVGILFDHVSTKTDIADVQSEIQQMAR